MTDGCYSGEEGKDEHFGQREQLGQKQGNCECWWGASWECGGVSGDYFRVIHPKEAAHFKEAFKAVKDLWDIYQRKTFLPVEVSEGRDGREGMVEPGEVKLGRSSFR